MAQLTVFVLFSLLFNNLVLSANVLGLFPFGAKSHFVVFDSLMRELARRGHSVVVVSPFQDEDSQENYTAISIKFMKEQLIDVYSFEQFKSIPPSVHEMANFFLLEIESNRNLLSTPVVQKVISNSTAVDVVFVETFSDEVFLLLATKFNVPIIGFSSCYPFSWVFSSIAVPQNPAYIPNFSSGYSKQMSLYERMLNTWLIILNNFYHKYILGPSSLNVYKSSLGISEFPLENPLMNISLLMVNTHFTFHNARPYPPQLIEVGGLHLKAPGTVSQDLDRWMNESSEGVIYFSFGSMLRGATLPADKVKAFLQVFESLPQRVLWKWEDDTVEKLPKNVKIMKWIPQRDVLAHPKVKVFISHGGLLGTTEAVVSGVPILGIPMYGDQPNNVAALVENGVAVHVDYNNISVASISYALNALINDKTFKENAKILSQRFLDRPMSPLDTAVYWTEYVIRHRGAPHLQSAAVHLTWYQYYLLDVIAVLTAAVLVILLTIYYIIRSSLRLICSSKPAKLKSN